VNTIKTLALVLLALAVAMPAATQTNRLYDKDVKQLLDQSKQSYERFWDALDSQIKNTTFKGPTGEWVVKKIDEDYRKVIDTARDRFNDSYSASTEVAAILRDATRTQTYVSQKGPGMKGASEWQAHAGVLGQLAAAYGGAFPPVENQPLRRYNDKEVITAARRIEESSKQFAGILDSTLKKDKSVPEAARKSMVTDAKTVGENAKALREAVENGRPASAQAALLLQQAKKVQDTFMAGSASAALNPQWGSMRDPLATIAAAFGVK
jgi:hypothetical protein